MPFVGLSLILEGFPEEGQHDPAAITLFPSKGPRGGYKENMGKMKM